MPSAIPAARELFGDDLSPAELSERKEALVKASTQATIDGLSGDTQITGTFDGSGGPGTPLIQSRARAVRKKTDELQALAKGADPGVLRALRSQMNVDKSEMLSKEWTLTTPLDSGLVPFDLEAPAKLLTPRPTPLRNSIPRVRGQGTSRRFKVISGFTGTGTGGIGTINPGFAENANVTGPTGQVLVRPPYINYAGYDVIQSYCSIGLSDSVSWQAEYQGMGFEDIRSLSNTALLYSTMLMEERLILYGRGTTANGYVGALGTPTVTVSAVAASVAGVSSTSLSDATYWVSVAADAGDLTSAVGVLHQGPSTTGASVAISGSGQAIKVDVTSDVTGALGYNIFVASASAGSYYYAGRTGYDIGYVTSAPTNTASISSAAADGSAVATNFDGLLTNLAASGGYVTRLNSTFSTSTPGVELQTAFSSLYDAVKADPDEVWFNGHDRNQMSNALLAGNNVNNYAVFVQDANVAQPGATVGALVQGIVNQITGKELSFNVHPWMPQGNVMVRSTSLPIPDSNVSQTTVMVDVQPYVAVQWPVTQMTYDASTLTITTASHYAPAWSALIQGVEQDG